MRYTLYTTSGLIIVVWGIYFFGYKTTWTVHLLLASAVIILIIAIIFSKQLLKK